MKISDSSGLRDEQSRSLSACLPQTERFYASLFHDFFRRNTCLLRSNCFLDDLVRLGRVFVEPLREAFVGCLLHERPHGDIAKFGFRLAFKLGFTQLHRDDGGETFSNVFTREIVVFSFSKFLPRAYLFITEVNAVRKPSTCMPPSMVEIPFA